MKVDLNMVFKEIDGEPTPQMKIIEDEEGVRKVDPAGNFFMKPDKDLTLRLAILNVLTNPPADRDDRGQLKELKGETKLEYAELAMRIHKAHGLYELTAKEIVRVMKLIDKVYRSPLIYKQAFEALEPHAAKEALDKIEEARKKEKEAEKAAKN